MEHGKPLARMIAVQVKATESKKYTAEDDKGFQYLLNSKDLDYWRPSNIPVIIVLYRQSDESFYWKEIPKDKNLEDRRLIINKEQDVLDRTAVDKLANLTIPKKGFGYYVPPLGDGEEALVNMLPIKIAVVGSAKTIESTAKFIEAATLGFDSSSEKHPNLHPEFPGLGNQSPYRCRYEVIEDANVILSQNKLDKISQEPNHQKAVELAVDEIMNQLNTLDESSNRPDVAYSY
mgnify:FL=1